MSFVKINNKKKNIGPAAAGPAGPVPAPLRREASSHT